MTEINKFELNGDLIQDIPSFYREINRVFMANETWTLGDSLDALDDMFYGGYGALNGCSHAVLIWRSMENSREALGYETTRRYYLRKLQQPAIYNSDYVRRQLAELEDGCGKTYFDTVMEIISAHPNITLRAGE